MPGSVHLPASAGVRRVVLTFLNNYRGGGIGDFGGNLIDSLRNAGADLEVIETRSDGLGLADQCRRIRTSPGPLLANLGLTAWGSSGPRNYRGFSAVGARTRAGRPTIAIVHHAIEMFGPEETGYRVSRLTRWGAHRALEQLCGADLLTFSPRLHDLLVEEYAARSVWLTPMPTGAPRPVTSTATPGRVVTAGYLAPYKGIDRFLDTAEECRDLARFSLVGRPHAVLSQRSEFAARAQSWIDRAHALGVATPGFLPPAELDQELSGRSIGLLPYSSASGASASFGLFAERGVPVIASDLPEFQYLHQAGAGIVVVSSKAPDLSAAVRSLVAEPARWERLAAAQRRFASENSWTAFVAKLGQRFPSLSAAL